MHSTFVQALVLCPPATLHSFPLSIMYSDALCLVHFLCFKLMPWSSSMIALITSVKTGSSLNHSLSLIISGVLASAMWNMSWVRPMLASSLLRLSTRYHLPFHFLFLCWPGLAHPLPHLGVPVHGGHLWFGEPRCHLAIRHGWHLACHSSGGLSALGNPFWVQLGSPTWCLQICPVFDDLFDAKPNGCWWCITFLLGKVYSNFCVNTALKASWDPSVVIINGVLSHLGLRRTSSDVISAFKFMKAFMWLLVHLFFRLWLVIIHLYIVFVYFSGSITSLNKSRNGCSFFAYPGMRSWKHPVSPRNPASAVAFSGIFQLTMAVSFLRSGCTPQSYGYTSEYHFCHEKLTLTCWER